MGCRGLISKDEPIVEDTSLTTLFEKQCPMYMSMGMTYDEFWYDTPYKAKFYREAYKLKVKHRDEEMWQQGVYIYEALCKVSPILHAFSKKGTKPLPYSDKPYLSQMSETERKISKEQEAENERLKAIVQFNAWAKAVAKKFNK